MNEIQQADEPRLLEYRLLEYARGCANVGWSLDEIKDGLKDKGCTDEQCIKMLGLLADQLKYEQDQRPAIVKEVRQNTRIKGICWLGGGLLLTFLGYNSSMEIGGTYVVFIGAILYGL